MIASSGRGRNRGTLLSFTMRLLVTGSAGHLGEALMHSLRTSGREALGIDIRPSRLTDSVGSITDREFVARCMDGVSAVVHAATLHKPHVGTHTAQAFIDTNVTGTLTMLEVAVDAKVDCFIFTSTTSAFGAALSPPLGERIRRRALTAVGRARRVDHGRRRAGAEEHLRRHEGRGREPV